LTPPAAGGLRQAGTLSAFASSPAALFEADDARPVDWIYTLASRPGRLKQPRLRTIGSV